MKSLLIALQIFATICWDCSRAQYHFNMDGEEYKFSFKTGDVGDHTREEIRDPFGTVIGKYSYIDPNGNRREMRYRADENGFQPEGYAVHRVPVVDALVQLEVQVPDVVQEPVQEDPLPQDVAQELISDQENDKEVVPETDLIKAQLAVTQTETTVASEQTAGITVADTRTTVANTRTETETTTDVATTVTEAVTASLTNQTESEGAAPSSEVIPVVDNSIDGTSAATSSQLTKSIHQKPRYPTLLRNPSLLESPVPLPVAFYHPYRLFNSNIRHIPVLGRGPSGPITFF